MAENIAREVGKGEAAAPTKVERTSSRPVFVPPTDIYETEDSIVLLADMPGVDEKSVDIRLEKGALTIMGQVEPEEYEDARPQYVEYRVGDYERAFTLSDEVDSEGISASLKDGVLRLELKKKEEVKPRRITVKIE